MEYTDIDVFNVGTIDWSMFKGEVDFSTVRYIDSSGLGYIHHHIKEVTKFIGLQPQPLRVLRDSGILGMVKSYSFCRK